MRKFLVALTFLVIHTSLKAQNFFVNVDAGAANYDGDLQDHRYTFQQSHFGGGLGLGYEFSPHFTLSTGFLYTEISGDDKLSNNAARRARNLNFTSTIFEWNVRAEYVLFDLDDRPLSPYCFGGVAIFHFDPYSVDPAGQTVYLHALSTEGEGLKPGRPTYALTQPAIPFGLGLKLALSENIRVGLEVGLRKTFTGYLDDVHGTYVDEATLLANKGGDAVAMAFRENQLPSHSGVVYPPEGTKRGGGRDDWYYFTGLRISIRLGGAAYTHAHHLGCPTHIL